MTNAPCPPETAKADIGTLTLLLDRETTVAEIRRSQSAVVEVPFGSENFHAECFYQLARLLEAEFNVHRDQLVESLRRTADVFEGRGTEHDTLFPMEADQEEDRTSFTLWLRVEFFSDEKSNRAPAKFSSRCTREGVQDRFFQLARLLEKELRVESTILSASVRYVATVLQEQDGKLAGRLPQPAPVQEKASEGKRNTVTLSLYSMDQDQIKKIRRLIEARNGYRRVSEPEAVRVALRFISFDDEDALFATYRAMLADDGRRRTTAGKR